jgi:glycosyltransferase involved in cell wall biosynthesis/peptidoglycan/xylan/chitin deacetylase (PgdA/CDA1 family)
VISVTDTPPPASASKPGTRRIRVMQVNYRHTFGGSERLAATIGTSLDPGRFESLFAAMKGDGEVGDMLRKQGYQTVVFGRSEGFDPLVYWRVWRYLKAHPVDIIQTHHVGSLVYCAPPARALGIKVVHTEHDIHSFIRLPNELRWIRRLSHLPEKYVVIDPTIGDFLEAEANIPREKLIVIRNGVNLDEFRPPVGGPAGPDKPFTLGWVSRLAPPKRPDILVEAMAILASEDPLLRARIIGGGDLFDGLADLVRQKGLSERIELLGPRSDIGLQLQMMDAYVLCSEREGLPISLVEAMATERPTIVSAVGGIPSLVKDRMNGYLLNELSPQELANIIRDIRRNPEQARQIAIQGAGDARRQFNLRETIGQYMDLFDQVAHRAPRPNVMTPRVKQSAYSMVCRTKFDGWFRGRHRDRLVILGYHGIVEDQSRSAPSWLMLRASAFTAQMRFLRDHYEIVSMNEAARRIVAHEPFEHPTACVTLDDGYRNNMTVALPILEQMGIPATIYLATGLINTDHIHWTAKLEQAMFGSSRSILDVTDLGLRRYPLGPHASYSYVRLVARLYRLAEPARQNLINVIETRLGTLEGTDFSEFQMMNWDEIRSVCSHGNIEFGGHTINHQIVEPLDDEELEFEIGGSIEEVRRQTKLASVTFAYPNGTPTDFDQRAERVLRDHQVVAAVSTIDGINDSSTNPFALRRITVGSGMSIEEFRVRTSGAIELAKQFIRVRA